MKFMIRKAIFMMALCLCGQMQVNAETMNDGTDDLVPSGINEDMLRQIEPTYLKEVAVPSAWSSNWFVGVSSGTSAFVGKPHGKGNLFDRMKPSLAIRQENGSRQRLVVGLVSKVFSSRMPAIMSVITRWFMRIFFGM